MDDFTELQRQVGEWHADTFPEATQKQIRRKLLEEAAETMCALPTGLAEELADVVLVCLTIAHRNEIDLLSAIEEKFEIVAGRDQVAREKR